MERVEDMVATATVGSRDTWAVTVERALRRLAAVTWAGALLGLLVGGIGSRLAMMLLARLNPEFAGVRSDDGFVMGRLSLDTVDLLVTTTLIGVFGGGLYFLVRTLMIGPRWFQLLSISVGPAVVAGSMTVHVEGVDFRLKPTWLAISMFVLIPGVYAALLTVVAEQWLAPTSRFQTGARWLVGLPLLLWVPLAPIAGVLLLVLLAFEAVRRTPRGRALVRHPAWPWAGRAALSVVFALSVVDLAQDTASLL
jgi:hypothetical protein